MSGLGIELRHDDEPPQHRRAMTTVVVIVAAVIVLGLLVTAVALGGQRISRFFSNAPDYSGKGTDSVVVVVHPGDSAAAIAATLKNAGVVASTEAFTDAASNDPKSRSIEPGSYRVHRHMQASLALALLLNPSSRVVSRVVIPEGTRLTRIVDIIHAATGLSTADINAATQDPAALGLPRYAKGSLEGFLFPATYDVAPGTSATDVLRPMVQRFRQEATRVHLVSGARKLGYTPYDVVTVASLVEKEARLTGDFGKVARVAYNRLSPAWGGKPFGFDSTLNYALPQRHGKLQSQDFTLDSPYNSRIHAGLPPTPIDSPGELALLAALHPTPGSWLYFVTIDQAGHTAFEYTKAQFDHDVAVSRANGVS
jgi:UPF0755 protein